MNESSFIIRYWNDAETEGRPQYPLRFKLIHAENGDERVFNELRDLLRFLFDYFEARKSSRDVNPDIDS